MEVYNMKTIKIILNVNVNLNRIMIFRLMGQIIQKSFELRLATCNGPLINPQRNLVLWLFSLPLCSAFPKTKMNRIFILISIKTNLYILITVIIIISGNFDTKIVWWTRFNVQMFKYIKLLYLSTKPWLNLSSQLWTLNDCIARNKREKTASIAVIIFVMYDNLNSSMG